MFSLHPQSSHYARAVEVAVKGKSPSYLLLFPHSSAGDRGGFSKPGGKLTSITLVSPLKALKLCFEYRCLLLWFEEILTGTFLKIFRSFLCQCLRPFSLGCNSVSAYGFKMSFWRVNGKSVFIYCFNKQISWDEFLGMLWGYNWSKRLLHNYLRVWGGQFSIQYIISDNCGVP